MKRLLYITLLIAGMLSAIGCEEKQNFGILPEKMAGQWVLTTVDSTPAGDRIVYVDIQENGSFSLYQKIWTSNYQKFTGSVELVGASGVRFIYSNGEASEYKTMTLENEKMTLVKESGETNVYNTTKIPQEVIQIAIPVTKATEALPFL